VSRTARDGRDDVDVAVDLLIEIYGIYASYVTAPGPCPMCSSNPNSRCPMLAMMDEIREFISDRQPNRLPELVE